MKPRILLLWLRRKGTVLDGDGNRVPELSEDELQAYAAKTKARCPLPVTELANRDRVFTDQKSRPLVGQVIDARVNEDGVLLEVELEESAADRFGLGPQTSRFSMGVSC